jgi:hypothetical protein
MQDNPALCEDGNLVTNACTNTPGGAFDAQTIAATTALSYFNVTVRLDWHNISEDNSFMQALAHSFDVNPTAATAQSYTSTIQSYIASYGAVAAVISACSDWENWVKG